MDLEGICSAVARTPHIEHEIQSLTVFPLRNAFAARVEVHGSLLLLCKDEDHWHVHSVSEYDH
jgi:hypothetical protein